MVSRTAQYVALYRALETVERTRPRLFDDPFAAAFLPPRLAWLVRLARIPIAHAWLSRYADRRAPGARTSAIARTRFIDDVVRERHTEQLVILGAGFDCRAHRLPELRNCPVFEVDRAETQAAKRAAVVRVPNASTNVIYVPVDFERDSVADRLAAAGWNPTATTTFIWEGVTNYLDEPAVTGVLGWIGRAAPSSAVVFTYIHKGLLDGTAHFDGGELLMSNVRALGEPWRFGLYPDAVAPFVGRFGLQLRENLGADEYRARYLPAGQSAGYAFYRIAVAEKAR